MKKTITTIAALAIAASVCATGVFAAGRNFRDDNRDGVCDNRTESWCGGRGTGFVDDDGDGVCDNRAAGCGQRRGGCRRG